MIERLCRLSRVAIATLALCAALPAPAQVITKTLTRTFDSSIYHASYMFFTATGPEAILTLDRAVGDCPSNAPCTVPANCINGSGWKCVNGGCYHPMEVQFGYVAVIRQARWCSIAACTGFLADLAPECPPSSVCDDSGTCGGPRPSSVLGLCLCSTGCDERDAEIPPGDVIFEETFDGTSGIPWTLGQAEIVTDASRSYLFLRNGTTPYPPTSLGQVRFHTTPGESYVLHVKWSYVPLDNRLNCFPFAHPTIALETKASTCAP